MTCQMDTLDVRRRMIEDTVSSEVIEASLSGLEFKANQGKAFSCNKPNLRKSSECPSWILKDLEVDWSV
jgi:hypothetical protein